MSGMVCCSLGVLFWEICTREIPVRGMLRPLRVPEECSPEVAQLIEVCMHFDPDLRPHARGVRPDSSSPGGQRGLGLVALHAHRAQP